MKKSVLLFLLSVRLLNYLLPYVFWEILFAMRGNPTGITLDWNRWDAPHYMYIAEHGYTSVGDPANFIVFQPLFPFLTKATALLVPNYALAGITLSIVLFVFGGLLFFNIIKHYFDKKTAWYSIIILSLFPTAYFFNAPYTESTFFFFSVLLLYLALNKKWLMASLAGGMTVLTRHVGLFLFIPLFFEWVKDKNKKVYALPFLPIAFIGAVAVYLYINYALFGNPFQFNTTLREHWYKYPKPFWESIYGSWLAVRTWPPTNYSIMIGLAEALPATIAVILIPVIFKLKKFGWGLFYTVYVIFICSTSFLMSTPRYLMVAFPLIVLFARISTKYPVFFYLWLLVSTSLLSFFSLQFISGQWAF